MRKARNDPRLDTLVKEIHHAYENALGDYRTGGMFSAHVHLDRAELCRTLIQRINELYQTTYEVPEQTRIGWYT